MDSPKHITTKSPRFIAFLLGQALGAANDNAIKVTMIAFVLATVAKEDQILYTSTIAALLPIAFLIFSPFAGYISDRYSKNKVLFFSKSPEVFAMLVACVALYMESLPLLLVCFFSNVHTKCFFWSSKIRHFTRSISQRRLTDGKWYCQYDHKYGHIARLCFGKCSLLRV